MAESDGEPVVVSWSGIWVTLVISFAQGLLFYWFFVSQRRKENLKESNDLYEPRQHTRQHRSPPPFAQSWIKAAWDVSQEELLRCVGLDSYMYLRFFRLGARICGVGTILSVVLIPVYATGEAKGPDTEEFNQLTLARVEANSSRLWASLFCWWIFIAFVLVELWKEWELYSVNRSKFLARGDEDMPKEFRYAVRVEQIPPAFQSDPKLKEYFERLFPSKVREATVYIHAEELQKLVDERLQVLVAMEKAVAFTKAKPDKPAPQVKVGGNKAGCGGEKVDAMEHYRKELDRLNDEIDAMRATLVGKDIETESPLLEPALTSESIGINESIEVDASTNDSSPDVTLVSNKEKEENQDKATSTGVVTFTSLRAKQAAVQCEMTGKTDSFTVVAAPDPEGIVWSNITTPLPKQRLFQFQAGLFWTVGVLFWAVPVGFVTSIANLNSILKTLGWGEADPETFWYGLVSGLLPVIALAILMAVLFMAIVAAATYFVRLKSQPEIDAYSFYWHMLYQFANLWLILIGGSAFNQIDTLVNDPGSVAQIIATALPGASTFFINMITVASFGEFGMELSLIPTYGVQLVMNIIQPEAMRTQRMLDDAKKAPNIIWGRELPPVVFIFLVSVLYMPIVPIVEAFGLVYFAGSYLVWKHQCLHVYAQDFEGGGEATWQQLFGFLMACLYTGEVVFIAYMGIKEAPVQGGLGFVPLVVTILVHMLLCRNVIAPLKNLSLDVAADVDLTDGELSEESDSKALGDSLYGQPALNPKLDERDPMPYRRESIDEAEKEEAEQPMGSAAEF